jgi:streptogramin lyase
VRALPLAATLIVALAIGRPTPASGGVRSFPLPPRTYGSLIAGLDGAPWFVTESDTTSTLKIADRGTGSFRDVALPFKARAGVAVDGAGWFLARGAQGTGALSRVDPVTGLASQVATTGFVDRVLTSDPRAHRVYFADSPQAGHRLRPGHAAGAGPGLRLAPHTPGQGRRADAVGDRIQGRLPHRRRQGRGDGDARRRLDDL